MKTRPLGKSGIEVSAVGLGCNALGGRIDLEGSRKVVYSALDLGVSLFDTASTYGNRYGTPGGSEIALGRVLGARRKDIVLATKFGTQSAKHASIPVEGASRREIMSAVEGSLGRLQTDYIDLYQLHHPDPATPIEETLRALDDLVRQGKVRFIGCSNFPAWRVADADWAARHHGTCAFVTCQAELSLVARAAERELLPAMRHYGVGLLPSYPLAAGLLTGKYRRDETTEGRLASARRLADKYLTDANWALVERLREFCSKRGKSLLDVAFGWLLANPVVASVIAGATTPEQVGHNVTAGRVALAPGELAEIERLLAGGDASPPSSSGAAAAAPTPQPGDARRTAAHT